MSSSSVVHAESRADCNGKHLHQAVQPQENDYEKSSLAHTHYVYSDPSRTAHVCITQDYQGAATPCPSSSLYPPRSNDNLHASTHGELNRFGRTCIEDSTQATDHERYDIVTPCVGESRAPLLSNISDRAVHCQPENIEVRVEREQPSTQPEPRGLYAAGTISTCSNVGHPK